MTLETGYYEKRMELRGEVVSKTMHEIQGVVGMLRGPWRYAFLIPCVHLLY